MAGRAPSNHESWTHRLVQAWQGKGWLARSLWPLSVLTRTYWEAMQLFRRGPPKQNGQAIPWVVVGNVVVGGAGKTPTTIALVRHWQRQGRKPGVVSKGHGRIKPGGPDYPFEVLDTTPASQSGDEPLLIRQSTGVPVVVGPDRLDAGHWLIDKHPELDVLICDDGLQDPSLLAAARIIVFDDRGIGNGWMLPAGMLRQPWPPRHVQPGDAILFTSTPSSGFCIPNHLPVFNAIRRLDSDAVNPFGLRKPLAELARTGPVTALAGIARPDQFFAMLQQAGISLHNTHALQDHQHFGQLIDSIVINELKRGPVFFTEKDAVKLFPALGQAGELAHNAWAVPLTMQLPASLLSELDARL